MKKVLALKDLILIDENLIPHVNKAKKPNTDAPNAIANTQGINLIDFDELMKHAVEAAYRASVKDNPSYLSISGLDYGNMQISEVNVTINHEPEFSSNPKAIFMGTNTFSNTTNETQTYKTDSYTKKIINKISSSVNWGISLKIDASYSIFNNKFTFSYNKTETTTNEKTIQINAPTQSLKLPPHTRYKVNVFLGQNDSEVNLNLHARISGTIHCYVNTAISCWFSIDMATALLFLPSLPHGISVDPTNKQIIFDGAATAKNVSQNSSFSVQIEKLSLE